MRDLGGAMSPLMAGSLLVAHPSMLDPNFRRAVLFIYEHDPTQGAGGVILNRPLHKSVADLVKDAPADGLAKVPVYLGGPVGRDRLMFAAFEWKTGEGLSIHQNLSLDEAQEHARKSGASIRAFVGYAGWSAGQLEMELKEQAWLLQEPTRARLTPAPLPQLWFDIMRDLGPWYKMMAAAPDDPSLN